jgi:hypothetical protein
VTIEGGAEVGGKLMGLGPWMTVGWEMLRERPWPFDALLAKRLRSLWS